MILFLDENMPPSVAAALHALGTVEAHHLLAHLPRGTPDEEIFEFVARRQWILLTQDERIKRNPHQRRALLESGIGAFILTGRAERSTEDMMRFLLERLPEMREELEGVEPPFIFGVPDRGGIQRLG